MAVVDVAKAVYVASTALSSPIAGLLLAIIGTTVSLAVSTLVLCEFLNSDERQRELR